MSFAAFLVTSAVNVFCHRDNADKIPFLKHVLRETFAACEQTKQTVGEGYNKCSEGALEYIAFLQMTGLCWELCTECWILLIRIEDAWASLSSTYDKYPVRKGQHEISSGWVIDRVWSTSFSYRDGNDLHWLYKLLYVEFAFTCSFFLWATYIETSVITVLVI